MKVFHGIDDFEHAVGTHLGYSQWHTITQDQVNLFADATGDHQWIHVDPERAMAGPFGGPIAHGYLTMSLIPMLLWEIYTVQGLSLAVNYGSDKVRFPNIVPVGSRVRAGAELIQLIKGAKGAQALVRVTVEIDGQDRPACVADILSLLV